MNFFDSEKSLFQNSRSNQINSKKNYEKFEKSSTFFSKKTSQERIFFKNLELFQFFSEKLQCF